MKEGKRIRLWHCVMLLLSLLPQAALAAAPEMQFDADELKAKIREQHKRIDSVYIEYRSYDYDGAGIPEGTYSHKAIALKSPNLLNHIAGHGNAALSWRDDARLQQGILHDGVFVNRFPWHRSFIEFELDLQDGLPGTLPGELFFWSTGIWPLTDIKAPTVVTSPAVLPAIAASEQYSFVRPVLESVDGHWCHVLEHPGVDSLWLDTNRGCALLARETREKPGGPLIQRVENTEHQEVAPGVWLPGKIRNIQFDYAARTPRGQQRRVLDAVHEVQVARANDVNDNVFKVSQQPGSVGTDRHGKTVFVPGGVEHLDLLADWIVAHAEILPDDELPSQSSWLTFPRLVLIGCAALAMTTTFRRLLS